MKKKILACVFVSALLLTGCNGVSRNTLYTQSAASPRVKVYSEDVTDICSWWYAVDENTGVVYLVYSRGGITVMLNPDGTAVTKEQLELQ